MLSAHKKAAYQRAHETSVSNVSSHHVRVKVAGAGCDVAPGTRSPLALGLLARALILQVTQILLQLFVRLQYRVLVREVKL